MVLLIVHFVLFIYLAAPGLSCGILDLQCSLQHAGPLILTCELFNCGMWDLGPWSGIRLGPPALGVWSLSHWTTRVVPSCLLWHITSFGLNILTCGGFPGGSDGKESSSNAGDLGSVPRLGWSPEEGNGYILQYSYLEKSVNREVWQAIVHGVTESTELRD